MAQPRIGLGLFVLNAENKFLLGDRLGSLGSSTLGLPGGHLEFGETFEACASRELLEETGILVLPSKIKFLTATNQPDLEGSHYVTIFMGCRVGGSEEIEPTVTEPTKCTGWHWIEWEGMKFEWERKLKGDGTARKLFQPLYDLFEQRQDFRLDEHL